MSGWGVTLRGSDKGHKGVLLAGYSLEHLRVRFVKINGAVFLMCALLCYTSKNTHSDIFNVSEYLRVSPREGAAAPVNTPDMSPKGEVLHHNQAAI